MDAVEAAVIVRELLLDRIRQRNRGDQVVMEWYESDVAIWSRVDLDRYRPGNSTAQAAVGQEGHPDGVQDLDCRCAELCDRPEVLERIPGWYVECENCSVALIYPCAPPMRQ